MSAWDSEEDCWVNMLIGSCIGMTAPGVGFCSQGPGVTRGTRNDHLPLLPSGPGGVRRRHDARGPGP